MNIAVISPQLHNSGNTTLSILIALELASRGKKICLSHADKESSSFYSYFNMVNYEDRTSTPSQVVKLIREGELKPSDISDYCKNVAPNLEVFANNSKAFSLDDMEVMVEYMHKSFPHDYIVFDVDVGVYDVYSNKLSKKVVEYSDAVVINLTQSIKQLETFLDRKDKIMNAIGNRPVVVVINKFCEIQSTVKEVAGWMGIKRPNNWLVLRYNPWLAWGTNHGKIIQVFNAMKKGDERLLDIASDVVKIGDAIVKIKTQISKTKAGVAR